MTNSLKWCMTIDTTCSILMRWTLVMSESIGRTELTWLVIRFKPCSEVDSLLPFWKVQSLRSEWFRLSSHGLGN